MPVIDGDYTSGIVPGAHARPDSVKVVVTCGAHSGSRAHLDDLRARFEDAYDDRTALLSLQNEMAGLPFLDPACGCGNFLIQAYKHLRGLEFEIIARAEELELAEIDAQLDLAKGKRGSQRQRNLRQRLQDIESRNAMQFADDALRKSKMSMRQFNGIEINEWPAMAKRTNIREQQSTTEAGYIFDSIEIGSQVD